MSDFGNGPTKEHSHSGPDDGGETLSPVEENNAITVDESYGGNSELGAAFNQARDDYPGRRVISIAPGTYTVTTPLDVSSNRDFANGWLDLRGVYLKGETAGDPVMDNTGSRALRLLGGRIEGMSTNTPSTGILLARDDSGASTGDDRVLGTTVFGRFQTSAVYSYGVEVDWFAGVRISNQIGDALYFSESNRENLSSPYVTIATGTRSSNDNWIGGASTLKTTANDAESAALVISGTDLTVCENSILLSDSVAHIVIDTEEGAVSAPRVTSNRFHGAGAGLPDHNLYLQDSSGGSGGDINTLWFTGNRPESTGPIIAGDGNPTLSVGFGYYGNRPAGGDAPDLSNHAIQHPLVHHQGQGFSGDSTFHFGDLRKGGSIMSRDFDWVSAPGGGVWANGSPIGTGNLANITPDYAYQTLRDDGSNGTSGEPYWADTGSTVWRAVADPSRTISY